MGLIMCPKIPKQWAIAHENDRKRENDKFSVIPLKHVQSIMSLVNRPGTPKNLSNSSQKQL
jgi:hypothetical protein